LRENKTFVYIFLKTNNMKKVFLILGTILLISGCGDVPEGENVDYEADVKPLIETDTKPIVRGSCNFIEDQGTCIDFIGEVFTEERMKLSCADGKFSLDACPYSDLGGCQATPGTITESIAWSYPPISAEEAGYQAKACGALGVAKWVKPEDLLKKE